jgi:RNA polymerase sigma factor (sigma-70 family)
MTDQQIEEMIAACFERPHDEGVIATFYTAFRPLVLLRLRALCRRDPSLCEDAYQTAFIRYIALFKEGRSKGRNYANYFLVIAQNWLIDQLRRESRLVNSEELFESVIGQPDRADERLMLLEALLSLDARCRFALERYYLSDDTRENLARQLKVSSSSIYMTVSRCRDELRRRLFSR